MPRAFHAQITVKMTENAEVSYRQASSMAQQALSQIRTVVSYGGEEKAITDYAAKLEDPVRVGQGSGFRVQGSGFRVQGSGFACHIAQVR